MHTTPTLATRVFAAIAAVSTTWVVTAAVVSLGEPDLQRMLAKSQAAEAPTALAAAAAPVALAFNTESDARATTGR